MAISSDLARILDSEFQAVLEPEWQRAKKEAGFFPLGAAWRAGVGVRWQKWRARKRDAQDVASVLTLPKPTP